MEIFQLIEDTEELSKALTATEEQFAQKKQYFNAHFGCALQTTLTNSTTDLMSGNTLLISVCVNIQLVTYDAYLREKVNTVAKILREKIAILTRISQIASHLLATGYDQDSLIQKVHKFSHGVTQKSVDDFCASVHEGFDKFMYKVTGHSFKV